MVSYFLPTKKEPVPSVPDESQIFQRGCFLLERSVTASVEPNWMSPVIYLSERPQDDLLEAIRCFEVLRHASYKTDTAYAYLALAYELALGADVIEDRVRRTMIADELPYIFASSFGAPTPVCLVSKAHYFFLKYQSEKDQKEKEGWRYRVLECCTKALQYKDKLEDWQRTWLVTKIKDLLPTD